MKIIEGGVCAVEGVMASGVHKEKYGLAIISNPNSNAAAVYTSNQIVAAPLIITKEHLKDGKLSAVIVNSGNANCFTGQEGLNDAKKMTKIAAANLKISPKDVGVSSTGVIGRQLPMEIIEPLIPQAIDSLASSFQASKKALNAIMTTDILAKEIAVETKLKDGEIVRTGGICKGSGMIAPNMATMLCFITTDVQATPQELKNSLKIAVQDSFNMVVVDGDESTNDTVIIMANGKSGRIDENFQEALNYLCIELARMMARDGEGATKLIEVTVKGASSKEDARIAAKAVVRSPLLKAAVFGADPNWGRIVAAIGYSKVRMDSKKISVTFSSLNEQVTLVEEGEIKAFEDGKELAKAENIMLNEEIEILVDLGIGKETATAYGCDLSYDYVKINAEYTT